MKFFYTLFFLVAFAATAHADLKVCNDTNHLAGVAVGYKQDENWLSQGWWHVPAGECSQVISGSVEAQDYYLFAENQTTGDRWAGDLFLCTSNIEFKITGRQNCYTRGYEKEGFFIVKTHNNTNWQVRLSSENIDE